METRKKYEQKDPTVISLDIPIKATLEETLLKKGQHTHIKQNLRLPLQRSIDFVADFQYQITPSIRVYIEPYMQERHIERRRYFEEQAYSCRKYYIPYIKNSLEYFPHKVLEVGCGEGVNLLTFTELGYKVVAVGIVKSRITQAETFFKNQGENGT